MVAAFVAICVFRIPARSLAKEGGTTPCRLIETVAYIDGRGVGLSDGLVAAPWCFRFRARLGRGCR
jgi:hypothetical protein